MQARWPLSEAEIQRYCQLLSQAGEEVSIEPLPVVIADPKDQAIIEAAVAGRVNAICTGDADFETQPVKEFLADFGIAVLADRDLPAMLLP